MGDPEQALSSRTPRRAVSRAGLGARAAVAVLVVLVGASVSRVARAQAPEGDLMARLASYAARFEVMRTHAHFTVEGHMETLDGDGKADSTKVMKAHVDAAGEIMNLSIERYTEDGEDKTADAQKKARDRAEKRKTEKSKKRVRLPILADEQARYVFDQVEIDRLDPSRVRIAFVPKEPAEDTVEGSAWVDARTGTVISAGFKLSKTPLFVDYVHFTVEFGAPTALGPAISTVSVEGKGGIPFFREHFRGTARLSDYSLAP